MDIFLLLKSALFLFGSIKIEKIFLNNLEKYSQLEPIFEPQSTNKGFLSVEFMCKNFLLIVSQWSNLFNW